MVTRRGSSFAGRVAESVLNAVGLPELIADDLEGYRALALGLAVRVAQSSLPSDLKIRGRESKYLLKESMAPSKMPTRTDGVSLSPVFTPGTL